GRDRFWPAGRQHEPQISVFVRGLPLASQDRNDDDVPQLRVWPWPQVGQPGLLPGLAQRNGQRVTFAGISVPTHLQPRLLALMPAQQDLAARRVHDQRRPSDVQWGRARPRIIRCPHELGDPVYITGLGAVLRIVAAQERSQLIVASAFRGPIHGPSVAPDHVAHATAAGARLLSGLDLASGHDMASGLDLASALDLAALW